MGLARDSFPDASQASGAARLPLPARVRRVPPPAGIMPVMPRRPPEVLSHSATSFSSRIPVVPAGTILFPVRHTRTPHLGTRIEAAPNGSGVARQRVAVILPAHPCVITARRQPACRNRLQAPAAHPNNGGPVGSKTTCGFGDLGGSAATGRPGVP
jgi:hypothetical protein